MKLLRYGEPGQEKPGLLGSDGIIRDLSGHVSDLAAGALDPSKLDELANLDVETLPAVSGNPRLGPCVAGTGKFICIGLNYSDHAAETGATVPPEPIIFMKATSAIVGPNDDLVLPRGSEKTDWEVELGIVIGKTAKYVSEARHSTTSPAIARSTMSPNALSRRNVTVSGRRANPATPSGRPDRGLSPRTRWRTRRISQCG